MILEASNLSEARVLDCDSVDKSLTSIMFYTMHKCASTFIAGLLEAMGKHSPYLHLDYTQALWDLGDKVPLESSYEAFFEEHAAALFRPRGELYGPIRRPIRFAGQGAYKSLFFLRDPRDAVISNFYSFAYTHRLPNNQANRESFLVYRDRVRNQGIDAYCLQYANQWMIKMFGAYKDVYDICDDKMYISYDDFAENPPDFIKRVCAYFEISLPDDVAATLAESAAPQREGAPVLEHKRSGKSGQYMDELRPETVTQLNEMLAPVLDAWGFARP